MDKAEVMKLLTDRLRAEEDEKLDNYYGIKRMQELNIGKGDGRRSRLSGKIRRMRNQSSTGTISLNTLRMLLGRGTEHVWVCPECSEVVPDNK